MCSFTVSPLWRRWYFHHEVASQFRDTLGETIGYCDATITGPTLPCRPIDTLCSGACTNLQTSAPLRDVQPRLPAARPATRASAGSPARRGQTACTGRCIDLNTDSNNCGACGRTCIGGQWCIVSACGGGTHYAVDGAPVGVAYIDACGAAGSQRILAFTDDGGTSVTLPSRHALVGRRPLRGDAHVHQLQRQRAGQHQHGLHLPVGNDPQRGLSQRAHRPAVARPRAEQLRHLRGHRGHRAQPQLGRAVGRGQLLHRLGHPQLPRSSCAGQRRHLTSPTARCRLQQRHHRHREPHRHRGRQPVPLGRSCSAVSFHRSLHPHPRAAPALSRS
ncbi:MAG: hypothetical protein IPF99_01315 [Deltaproteobacteria bacterium]|nr:hypothetical protein [Deltaproteobacteria bacterium]